MDILCVTAELDFCLGHLFVTVLRDIQCHVNIYEGCVLPCKFYTYVIHPVYIVRGSVCILMLHQIIYQNQEILHVFSPILVFLMIVFVFHIRGLFKKYPD